ncbi:MAG: LptF/LptG family permease [Chitinophagaceae bacterium]
MKIKGIRGLYLSILDRYILKKFVSTFLFSILLFMLITLSIDYSENADVFIRNNLSIWELMNTRYKGYIPLLASMLMPIFVFLSIIFLTSRLALHNEIIAMKAAGVSTFRFLKPYIIAGLLCGTINWVGLYVIVPHASKLRSDFELKYIDHGNSANQKFIPNKYIRANENEYWVIKNYDVILQNGRPFFVDVIINHELKERWIASSLKWNEISKKWQAMNVKKIIMQKDKEKMEVFDSLFLNTNLLPDDILGNSYLKDNLTTPELERMIRKKELQGGEDVSALIFEKHRRNTAPFTIVLLSILAAILASKKIRGGSGLHISIGFLLMVTYVLCDRFSNVFATKANFPPMLAAWTPNLIFIFITYYIYKKNK